MSLTEKDVKYVAKLSALHLEESEVAKRVEELSAVLEYCQKLSEVSTRGVVPTSHVHGVTNFFREDITKDSFSMEEIEKLTPDFKNGCFRVPKIIA